MFGVVTKKLCGAVKQDDIIKELFKFFLNNWQNEEQIMRGWSNFVFESVEY